MTVSTLGLCYCFYVCVLWQFLCPGLVTFYMRGSCVIISARVVCVTWPVSHMACSDPPTLLELGRAWPAVTPSTFEMPWVQSPLPRAYSYIQQIVRKLKTVNAKNPKKITDS